ncbi:alpha/beta fold hydrolase [Alsobacter sp. R-9]
MALSAIVTAACGLVGAARAGEEFPAPGVLYQAGAETLHLYCTGDEGPLPTVILEAGLGGNHLDWTYVQPLLAGTTRTCSYDRAGAGFSTPAGRPRTVDNIVEDLDRLLHSASINGPLVLVGHSFGGVVAAHYAALHPTRVGGLVLVDSMHPDQFARFGHAGVGVAEDPYRFISPPNPASAIYGLPESMHRRAISLAVDEKARKAVIGEIRSNAATLARLNVRPAPSTASRVLVHGDAIWNRLYPDGRMERVWLDLQRDLAAIVGAPAPVVVRGTGHQIQLDAPEAVAAAVRDVLAAPRPAIAKAPP